MKCANCQEKLNSKTVSYSVTRKGYDVILHDVPALVCDVCGEVFFAEDSVRKIQGMVGELDETSKKVRKASVGYPFVQAS